MNRFPLQRLLLVLVGCLLTATAHAGAWGPGSFENDDALDFVDLFESSPDRSTLMAVLVQAATGKGYLQADMGAYAIVAAEIMAGINGVPSGDLPERIVKWARQQRAPTSAELAVARRALRAVRSTKNSELAQLFDEDDDLRRAWLEELKILERRLR